MSETLITSLDSQAGLQRSLLWLKDEETIFPYSSGMAFEEAAGNSSNML